MKKREQHGLTKSPEYQCYIHMKKRCYNKNNKAFNNYGGRGIKISNLWLESFLNFYADMGPRPSKDHSIDRIDNNGNYEFGNCRWATRKEQTNNRRLTRKMLDQLKKMNGLSVKSRIKRYGNPLIRTEKICPRCKIKKELICFAKYESSQDKHNHYCKQCVREQSKLRRSK